jgi:ubiquinone/menaquinone biosynthesis C-methylase UbiE
VSFYEEQILPRVIDVLLGNRRMAKLRRRTLEGLSGTVVELGFGSGPNVPLYPPTVERVLAVDPSLTGRRLAARRLAASPVPVEFVGLDGEHLPLDDDSVDAALSTWTLCTIPHADVALQEVHRVLRPGGRFHFLEHGLCPDPRVAARQHRFNGLQRRIAGGCNLDRDIGRLVGDSPLEVESLSTFFIQGPKILSWMYAGTAVKPAA